MATQGPQAGWTTKRVLVLSVDGTTAHVRDQLGQETTARADLSPSSLRPQPGERWLMDRVGNTWMFSWLDGAAAVPGPTVTSLISKLAPPTTVPVPATTVAADTPVVTSSGAATITTAAAQVVGPHTSLVTQVGSRGTWNPVFGRLPVFGRTGLDFYLHGQNVEVHAFPGFSGACPLWVWVNGAPVTAAPTTVTVSASTDVYVKLAFPSAGRRRIEFFMLHSGSWYDVRADYTSIISPSPRKPVGVWVGDSFWDSSNASVGMQCADFLMSRMLGLECFSASHGGTGYVASGSFDTFGSATRLALVASAKPDVIFVQGSVNDDASTPAQVKPAAAAFFAALAEECPTARVIVFGPQPSNAAATLSTARAANNLAVAQAAAAAPNVLAYHDMIGTASGAVPPAFGTFLTYPDGTLLTYRGSVWRVNDPGGSYSGGPLFPPEDGRFELLTYSVFGTGQVGSTAGDGNRDTLVYSDGVHPMPELSAAHAIREVGLIRSDLAAAAALGT